MAARTTLEVTVRTHEAITQFNNQYLWTGFVMRVLGRCAKLIQSNL